ncbi:hypothetical protein D1007_12363 [Hordeum vulgare]|nr:hypothetical protein D1007_12363 [Hordeum vulgare]
MAPPPALGRSTVVNIEELEKIRLVVAAGSNEWGAPRCGQIHGLHLDPSSLVLLLAFAFLCEAFVRVTPSVALLHHFFSLELFSEEQCSGCASLKMAGASVPGALDAELHPKAEGFRW